MVIARRSIPLKTSSINHVSESRLALGGKGNKGHHFGHHARLLGLHSAASHERTHAFLVAKSPTSRTLRFEQFEFAFAFTWAGLLLPERPI
eukprot:scaffold1954_cov268-Pinguiococcus_pyrenoidosus.AAC.223